MSSARLLLFALLLVSVGMCGCAREGAWSSLNGYSIAPASLIEMATDTGFAVTCSMDKDKHWRNCKLVPLSTLPPAKGEGSR